MVEGTKVLEIDPDAKELSIALGIVDTRKQEIKELTKRLMIEQRKLNSKDLSVSKLLVEASKELIHPNELAYFSYMLSEIMAELHENGAIAPNGVTGRVKGRSGEIKEIKADSISDLIKLLRRLNED